MKITQRHVGKRITCPCWLNEIGPNCYVTVIGVGKESFLADYRGKDEALTDLYSGEDVWRRDSDWKLWKAPKKAKKVKK